MAAAALTSAANIPQLLKAWRTSETEDLSLRTLIVLCAGLALWLAYGILRPDLVIILGNAVALAISGSLLALKLRYG